MDEGIGDDRDRGEDIEPEQNQKHRHLPAQSPSRQERRARSTQLPGLQGGDEFRIMGHGFPLFAQEVGKDGDNSIETPDDHDQADDRPAGEIGAPGIRVPAHDLAVVDQQQQEKKGGRHQEGRDDVDGEGQRKQRRARDQHHRRRDHRGDDDRAVEQFALGEIEIEAVPGMGGLTQGVGGTGGDRHRRDHARLDDPEREQCRPERAEIGLEGGCEIGAAREAGDIDVMDEQRRRRGQRRDRGDGGQDRADRGIHPSFGDVGGGQALVHHRALLEENHPRCDGRADIGHAQRDEGRGHATRDRAPGECRVEQRRPARMGEQGGGDEQQIEQGERHQRPLPGRVTPERERGQNQRDTDRDREPRGHAEIEPAGLDRDEFGDQGQKIAEHQIGHREIAPERAETLKNQFGMAAMRHCPEAHRHFLHDEGHDEGEQDERDEEADPVGRPRRRVGDHAGAVILAQHDQNARPGEQPEQAQRALFRPRVEHDTAVPVAQEILAADGRAFSRIARERHRKLGRGLAHGDFWDFAEF